VTWRVPFNKPTRTGTELEYVARALESGHLAGDGPFTQQCEEALAALVGAPRVLLTTSCTHALELAALLLDVGPGDEVIVPSFTFVSTAAAFALRGANIVFADVRPDTLNLDEQQLPELVTERTRAIVVVHYGGIGCALEQIGRCAEQMGVTLVEDNAHGLFGKYHDQPLGSFGRLATQSFHETKNVTCGEGGALVINDPDLVQRAEILREKGTERKRMFRGEVDKYTWSDLGSSYVLSELNAAVLAAQLDAWRSIQDSRRSIWQRYQTGLVGWADRIGASLPVVPDGASPAFHLFHVLLPSIDVRSALISHLRERGILAVFHYLPLHLSPMGRLHGSGTASCPVAEEISDRLVRLPMYSNMTDEELDLVLGALHEFEPA